MRLLTWPSYDGGVSSAQSVVFNFISSCHTWFRIQVTQQDSASPQAPVHLSPPPPSPQPAAFELQSLSLCSFPSSSPPNQAILQFLGFSVGGISSGLGPTLEEKSPTQEGDFEEIIIQCLGAFEYVAYWCQSHMLNIVPFPFLSNFSFCMRLIAVVSFSSLLRSLSSNPLSPDWQP